MRFRTVPLRTGIGLTILLMGLFTILLVFISEEVYRDLAIDSQRTALRGLVQLKAEDLLEGLRRTAVRLGQEVQQEQEFRAAFADRDEARLARLLDNHFHQYYVTAGLLDLERVQALDSGFAELARAGDIPPATGEHPCPDLTVAVLARSGSARLQPLSQLCTTGDTSHLAVVVPIGLRPDGYIQVVTDPLHALRRLEQELGMPLRLTRPGGESAYRSQGWDAGLAAAHRLTVDYPLPGSDGSTQLTASLLMDMQGFFTRLRRTRDTVLLSVALATLVTMLLARLLTDRLIVRPIQSLCSQLRRGNRELLDTELHARKNVISEYAELGELCGVLDGLAYTDSLTGLPNRTRLEQRLQALLADDQGARREHALCHLDLDRFRIVNDTCGHTAGDTLLRQLAGVLRDNVRDRDLVARVGGDDFAVLLADCGTDQARGLAAELNRAVNAHRFTCRGQTFQVGASIGVVPFGNGGKLAEILAAADTACHLAKEKGRNRVHFFQPDDRALLERRDETRWANLLTEALDTGGFELYAQPIHPAIIGNGARRMREVLVWMIDAEGNRISPRSFIPAAERYHLMNLVDRWVIEQLCSRIHAEQHDERLPVYTVNLSGQSLSDEGFLHFLIDTLDSCSIPTERLCFEITETAAITNLERASRMISILKGMGLHFALDDFGSGLSSFSYLKHLNVDFVKIDGSFVRNIAGSEVDRRMVEAINQLAHTMGIRTIAECVENEETYTLLQDMGVDYLQGYYIGRPLPIERMLEQAPKPRDPDARVVPIR